MVFLSFVQGLRIGMFHDMSVRFGLICTAATLSFANGSSAEPMQQKAAVEQLQQQIDILQEQQGSPGASIAVIDGGTIG